MPCAADCQQFPLASFTVLLMKAVYRTAQTDLVIQTLKDRECALLVSPVVTIAPHETIAMIVGCQGDLR